MKGVIFGSGKLGYKDLPKIATTTIKHAIYEIEAGEKYSATKAGTDIHGYFKVNMGNICSCDKRIILVRDPVKRFLSAYKNRVLHHYELSEPFIKSKFPEYYWDVPYFTPGLGQFIDHLEDYLKIRPISHHCRPVVDFLSGEGLDFFSHVYKFENLDVFEDDLSEWVGKQIKFARMQTGGSSYSLRDLSEEQMVKLIEYYKDDYKLLENLYGIDELWREWRGVEHDSKVPRTNRMMKKPKSIYSLAVGKIKRDIGLKQ